jgi:RNA polymerase sigma-70 factor (ECF subfamily)
MTADDPAWERRRPEMTLVGDTGARTSGTPDEWAPVVKAAAAGDRASLHRLLAHIRPKIVRYCRVRIGQREQSHISADDVAQEVCLGVLRALPNYVDHGKPFLAFVYGIAQHKVADAHRAAARNRAEPVDELPEVGEQAEGPEQLVLAEELSARVAQLLEVLPEKQGEILRLRIVVGMSTEETATMVGSTPGAVRVAQHRALACLRDHPLFAKMSAD